MIRSHAEGHFLWKGTSYPLIDFYCEYYDWQKKFGKNNKPESGAWLYKAIVEKWQPPAELKTKRQIETEVREKREYEQREMKADIQRKEEEKKQEYLSWLAETPEERWRDEIFIFRINFRKKYDRIPTEEEIEGAREIYLNKPESPQEYQIKTFGEVKYPTKVK